MLDKTHTSAPSRPETKAKPPIGMAGHVIKTACSNCNLRELCMPVGLNEEQLQRIDEVVAVRRKS